MRGEARSKVKAEFQGIPALAGWDGLCRLQGRPPGLLLDVPAAHQEKGKPSWAAWCHCRAETWGPGISHLQKSSLGRELSVSSGSPLLFTNLCCLPRASAGRAPSSILIYPVMSPIPVHPDITSAITSPSPHPWGGSRAGKGGPTAPAVPCPTAQLKVPVALRRGCTASQNLPGHPPAWLPLVPVTIIFSGEIPLPRILLES